MTIDPLFQTFQIGSLTLRNRIVSTSHEPSYTDDALPKDRYRRYHLEKARGGIGLTMIGGSALVSKDSPAAFGNIDMTRDEVVPWLQRLSDDVHSEGAAVMIQLTHLGWRSSNFQGDWLPLVAPSRVKEQAHRSFTKAMEDWDMDRIVADFASAARRAADGGLDGLEIMHMGHLLDLFVHEEMNHREDEYNGDFENSLRFLTRVVDAVREAVPADFVIGLKASVDDCGSDEDLVVRIVNELSEHGIQFLNLITGSIDKEAGLARQAPGMGTPSAPHLDLSRRIRERISIPVMHATRIADVTTARHAIESGAMDLVGMVRANIADPYLPIKAQEGREDDIRPCVGANQCLDSIYSSGSAICVHNPATGREETLPQQIEPASVSGRKKVVVIGSGPGGLEAARVCAVRGHEVIVLEADTTYGGQVRTASRSERRRDLIGIVDWRYQQCKKRNVDFRFGVYAEADDVLSEEPDVVIVATGGVPDTEIIGGARTQIHDVWDVLQDSLKNKQKVMVFDDHGFYQALDAAERLARNGQEVLFVTPDRAVGADVGGMNGPAYMEAFSEFDVEVRLGERLVTADRGDRGNAVVTLRNEYSGKETEVAVDAVVVDRGVIPNEDLYFELKEHSKNRGEVDYDAFVQGASQERTTGNHPEGAFQLFRVGDAVTSRNIHAAILDALRLGLGV
ncbi:oxidoreductase [Leucobacter sp. GX24907]